MELLEDVFEVMARCEWTDAQGRRILNRAKDMVSKHGEHGGHHAVRLQRLARPAAPIFMNNNYGL